MAAGAHGVLIDDFNGDNFDHGGLGFFGGAWIQAGPTNGRPIATRAGAARHAALGPRMEGGDGEMVQPRLLDRRVRLQLRPPREFSRSRSDLSDALGRPLIRMSYNFRDNDYKLADYVGGVLGRLAKAMNPTVMSTPSVKKRRLQRRALSVDPQYRRHHDRHRSEDERRQPLSAVLGRRQSVRHGRLGVSAERLATIRPVWSARSPIGRRTRSRRNISRARGRWCTPKRRRTSAGAPLKSHVLNAVRSAATSQDRSVPSDYSNNSPRSASPHCRCDRR